MKRHAATNATSAPMAVSNSASDRRELVTWVRDFSIGLVLAVGSGLAFAAVVGIGHG